MGYIDFRMKDAGVEKGVHISQVVRKGAQGHPIGVVGYVVIPSYSNLE